MGASASGKRFGCGAVKELRKRGFEIIPVHPTAGQIMGVEAYPSIASIPGKPDAVLVVVPPARSLEVVRQAHEAGVTRVWMQQGAESEEALAFCAGNGMTVVQKECILMFAGRVGFPHSLHRWVWGMAGKLPA